VSTHVITQHPTLSFNHTLHSIPSHQLLDQTDNQLIRLCVKLRDSNFNKRDRPVIKPPKFRRYDTLYPELQAAEAQNQPESKH
jgi:hypothetical protein